MANDLLSQVIDFISSFMNGGPKSVEVRVTIPLESKAELAPSEPVPVEVPQLGNVIDWLNPTSQISPHFTVKDALYLPTWSRLANEKDGLDDTVKSNLLTLITKMETVRSYFNKPIRTHVTYRPVEYNKAIGGALHSQHSVGLAMDFDVIGMNCDDVRKQINDNNMLDAWNMRMEDNGMGASWIHLDMKEMQPGMHRFFKP